MSAPHVLDLPADVDGEVALRAFCGVPFPIFFDSAQPHPQQGRYSFLSADPFAVIRCRGNRVEWPVWPPGWATPTGDPFQAIREVLCRCRSETMPGLPPFQGGAAGLFSYDLCRRLERLPRPAWDEFAAPDLVVGFYDWTIAIDHQTRQRWLMATGWPEGTEVERRRRCDRRAAWALGLINSARRGDAPRPGWPSGAILPLDELSPQYPLDRLPGLTSNFSRDGYLRAIRRAIEYIYAGDCFQVNLSQRLLFPLPLPPLEVYLRLRQRNSAPFAAYFDLGDFVIASASPERFLQVSRSGEVETRPIKGTRPRGGNPLEDLWLKQALCESEKDRAENVMIVDLLRNDLGRVCRYGSIRVAALCEVESNPAVHHLVSAVCGRLRPECDALDLLRVCFPGGSVTGAPKVRAMEIIAELEPTVRGPYCGSLAYIGFDGAMDSSILIRTFTIGRGWLQFPVGGGIVADSEPDAELAETLHKAEGLFRALA